jgi:hypothetical protein
MKRTLLFPVILIVFPILLIGCSGSNDNFFTVRDYVLKLSGGDFKTDVELSVNTDNLSFLKSFSDDIDFDDNDLRISDISYVDIGSYSRIAGEGGIRTKDIAASNNLESVRKRLRRSGYDLITRTSADDEMNLIAVREGNKGAAYFVHLQDNRVILVKLQASIYKN